MFSSHTSDKAMRGWAAALLTLTGALAGCASNHTDTPSDDVAASESAICQGLCCGKSFGLWCDGVQTLVLCDGHNGEVFGGRIACGGGCRSMRDGVDDVCNAPPQPPSNGSPPIFPIPVVIAAPGAPPQGLLPGGSALAGPPYPAFIPIVQGTTTPLLWQPVTSATFYEIEWSTWSFEHIAWNPASLIQTFQTSATISLPLRTQYKWRARAWNNAGAGPWSPEIAFWSP
jgi:hypothetical protein